MGKVILAGVFVVVATFCYFVMDMAPAVSGLLGVIVCALVVCACWALVSVAQNELDRRAMEDDDVGHWKDYP